MTTEGSEATGPVTTRAAGGPGEEESGPTRLRGSDTEPDTSARTGLGEDEPVRSTSPASEEYVDFWMRLIRPREAVDDPGDAARWDRRKALEQELSRTGVDPIARELRAAGADGSQAPTAPDQGNEEDG